MQYLSFWASCHHKSWNRDFMIKVISTIQEYPASSKPPVMSPIFERLLDDFKLNIFQPNFKHRFLVAYLDNPKGHQGHQPYFVQIWIWYNILANNIFEPNQEIICLFWSSYGVIFWHILTKFGYNMTYWQITHLSPIRR